MCIEIKHCADVTVENVRKSPTLLHHFTYFTSPLHLFYYTNQRSWSCTNVNPLQSKIFRIHSATSQEGGYFFNFLALKKILKIEELLNTEICY